VSTPDDDAVAAGHSVDPARWRVLFDELMILVAGRFGRVEPRRAARDMVPGLLSPAERKNCWWLAEHAGHGDPQAMQRLLRTAMRDADAVRDDLRAFVAAQLGDAAGVGVQRQYSGTAGRIENSQVGVFVSYASPRGRALIDRRIYLPKSWTGDRPRCAAARVPAEVEFATKPELALEMIAGAVTAGMPAAWVASDEAYGDNGAFRAGVAALGLGYVLAVSCTHRIPAWPGGKPRLRADYIAAVLPRACWHRISAGTGSKGPHSARSAGSSDLSASTNPPATSVTTNPPCFTTIATSRSEVPTGSPNSFTGSSPGGSRTGRRASTTCTESASARRSPHACHHDHNATPRATPAATNVPQTVSQSDSPSGAGGGAQKTQTT
jgi:DDE superfamily endonuclease